MIKMGSYHRQLELFEKGEMQTATDWSFEAGVASWMLEEEFRFIFPRTYTQH
jgi:hypothetical protein